MIVRNIFISDDNIYILILSLIIIIIEVEYFICLEY
jgi:hypothetical protein